jgi:hypothetical protein
VWIREKLLWKEKFQLSLNHRPSLLLEESLLLAITVVSSDTSELSAHISKLRGIQIGRLLELPCVINVELAVMIQASWISSQKSYSKVSATAKAYSSKEDLGPQEALCGETEDCRYLELQLKKGGQDKEDGTHSPKECVTYLVGEFTHMPRILVPKS